MKSPFSLSKNLLNNLRYKGLTEQQLRSLLQTSATISQLEITDDENVCNPLRNTINENVSRIRNAFRAVVDDSIAQNYYIQGHQGEAMTIKLDRNLVKM